MTRCVLLAVLLVCSQAATARAGWMGFDFDVAPSGIGVAYGTRLGELGLTYGMAMSGRVTYDLAVTGVWVPDPVIEGKGQVLRYSAPGSFTLEVGGHTFASASGGSLQIEWREPSAFFPTGLFSIQTAPASGPTSPYKPGSQLYLSFAPWSAVSWSSPTTVPDLNLFAESSGQVALVLEGPPSDDYFGYTREVFVQGFITEMTPVAGAEPGAATTPEPGTLTLAALGAGLTLTWRRWRSGT